MNEQKCFEALELKNYARARKWTELWTFVSGKFLPFTFFLAFFPAHRVIPARGRNNLYSWGLFLKGTGTIYLPRFLPPFYMLIWSWFDHGWLWSLKRKKGVKFNGASTRIRTSSRIYEKFPSLAHHPYLFLYFPQNLSINLRFRAFSC